MLSTDRTIKNPKDLCRYVNRRTVVRPIERVNRILAAYSSDYIVKASYTVTGLGSNRVRTLLLSVALSVSPTRPIRNTGLVFPMSNQDFVAAVADLDRAAEERIEQQRQSSAGGLGSLTWS